MSEKIEDQVTDLVEDINEDQLETMAEDVEVDEELTEASAKKEAKDEKAEADVEVDDEDGEVEDEDEDEEEDMEEKKACKKESVEMPTTKAGILKAMYESMSEMSKDDLTAAYGKLMGEDVAEEVVAEAVDSEKAEETFKEDLDALVDGEETLTEDFRGKAAVIFEAAVASKVSAITEALEEQKEQELAEQVESVRTDLVEKVDGYLNYVVEQWMSENEVAITNGLRTEIAENFIESLKTVFVENYVEVPDSKLDMVDELATKVEELDESLQQSIEDNMELAEKVAAYRRDEILREATVGMAETEVEKLRGLTEDLDFEDAESFEKKVATIKESYMKVKSSSLQEDVQETDEQVQSPAMAAYLKALSKTK